jgi:hypothetical protein
MPSQMSSSNEGILRLTPDVAAASAGSHLGTTDWRPRAVHRAGVRMLGTCKRGSRELEREAIV